MTENEKRIVVRVDPETWRKYDDKRHSERVSFQELGQRLFSQWEGTSMATPEAAKEIAKALKTSRTSRHQEWIDKLVYILDSNSADAIEAVTSNISVFYRLAKVDEKKAAGGTPKQKHLP